MNLKIELPKYGVSTKVNASCYAKVSKHNWYLHSGYVVTKIKKIEVSLASMVIGKRKGKIIDHINRDKLDNRRENLRHCDRAENARNVGIRKNNRSGFNGVARHKKNRSWVAYIGKKRKYLGSFPTAKEAAKAYDAAAKKLFGEFACLNFPG